MASTDTGVEVKEIIVKYIKAKKLVKPLRENYENILGKENYVDSNVKNVNMNVNMNVNTNVNMNVNVNTNAIVNTIKRKIIKTIKKNKEKKIPEQKTIDIPEKKKIFITLKTIKPATSMS